MRFAGRHCRISVAGGMAPLLLGLLLLSAGGLGYAEETGPDAETETEAQSTPFDPTLLSWSAGEGVTAPNPDHGQHPLPPEWDLPAAISEELVGGVQRYPAEQTGIAEEAPGRFSGGVELLYERVRLAGDQLLMWQTPIAAGDQQAWPERVYLLPGAAGPEPDRVHIDSRYSELESINFTGFLRPQTVAIDRAVWDPAQDYVVYRMLLSKVGRFRGEMKDGGGSWTPISGQTDYLLMILHATKQGDSLASPRLAEVHFIAEGDETGVVSPEDRVILTQWVKPNPRHLESVRVSLYFAADGTFARFAAGKDSEARFLNAGTEMPDHPEYHIAEDEELEQRKQRRRQREADAAAPTTAPGVFP